MKFFRDREFYGWLTDEAKIIFCGHTEHMNVLRDMGIPFPDYLDQFDKGWYRFGTYPKSDGGRKLEIYGYKSRLTDKQVLAIDAFCTEKNVTGIRWENYDG